MLKKVPPVLSFFQVKILFLTVLLSVKFGHDSTEKSQGWSSVNLKGTGITQVPAGYLDFYVLDSRYSPAHWAVNPTLQDGPWCTECRWAQNTLYVHLTLLMHWRMSSRGSALFLEASRFSKYRAVQKDLASVRLPNIWKFWKNIKAKPWLKVLKRHKRHGWRSQDNDRTEELSLGGQGCCWWHSRNLSLGILGQRSLLIHQ